MSQHFKIIIILETCPMVCLCNKYPYQNILLLLDIFFIYWIQNSMATFILPVILT